MSRTDAESIKVEEHQVLREKALRAKVIVDSYVDSTGSPSRDSDDEPFLNEDEGQFFDNDVFASERAAEQVVQEAGYQPGDPLYDRVLQIAQTAGERAIRALLVNNEVDEILIYDDEGNRRKFVEKVYVGYQDH